MVVIFSSYCQFRLKYRHRHENMCPVARRTPLPLWTVPIFKCVRGKCASGLYVEEAPLRWGLLINAGEGESHRCLLWIRLWHSRACQKFVFRFLIYDCMHVWDKCAHFWRSLGKHAFQVGAFEFKCARPRTQWSNVFDICALCMLLLNRQ